MPVNGSGTFVWWKILQDPALVFGTPEVGLQDEQGNSMETAQVDPDIQVMNDPKSTAEGRDLQLERAVAELVQVRKFLPRSANQVMQQFPMRNLGA
jgi:C-terminal processing protease CtpA/Prc